MRGMKRLTAIEVSRQTKPGRYGDGGGLWLQVSEFGTKAWLFRYMRHGKARQMGLGPVHTVTLAMAREKALACRRQLLDGIDPIETRRTERSLARVSLAKGITFKECAERYVKAHQSSWRNAKHGAQWKTTLVVYAYPVIGDLPVGAIDTGLVLKALEPIWNDKTETAGRIRGRIESVLDWATARGYRQGENPARWRGHLDKLLPSRRKLSRVEHHAALPYPDLGAFMSQLRQQPELGARTLEFVILTAARTGEAMTATWQEIDVEARVWTVPADRIKGGKEHRVPLSDRVIEILSGLPRMGDLAFPGNRKNRPQSHTAMRRTLKRMGRSDLTTHGFRSTFRDWAAETTAYPNEVVEMALAHTIESKVEAAYRRGDLFEKRRRLMADWAAYCAAPARSGEVVAIREREHG